MASRKARTKKAKGDKKGAATKKVVAKAAAPVKNSQILPSKEASLFKQILRHYETKQYKKGLKVADNILKNFPLHGETLAMKGLTMNCLKRKDEAYPLVKKGLTMNMKSHVCWHVYGLLYRSDRKYDDAIKCYQNALRHEKDNQQILKDLANLQIQRRMLGGYQETRRKLLLLKKNNRSNWIAYAVGAHLCGQHTKAITILDSFLKNQDENKIIRYELSEMMIYKNIVLTESGNVKKAQAHLKEVESKIVDKIYLRETQASLLLKNGDLSGAEAHYRALLAINCENYDYHYGLVEALGLAQGGKLRNLAPEKVEALTALYTDLAKQYPTTTAVQRLRLEFLTGDAFKQAVGEYMQERLRKGIPSLFRDLRSLYFCADKAKVIAELVNTYTKNLRNSQRFTAEDEAKGESPSVLVWTLYYQGHQLDHNNKYNEALTVVDEALAHTPTNIDLYVLKARIFKHAGDVMLAHEWMEEARKMDTADRYLNTKCVRYCLRADKQKEAEDTVSLFLRDGDDLHSLFDMQCSWYELQYGHSHIRLGKIGKALKSYISVTKHFQDMEEDQFDFHTYCLKKMTLRAYISMIRMEDTIRSHRFYNKAARHIVAAYITMWDARDAVKKGLEAEVASEANLTPAEQKRLEKKRKREAAKKARAAAGQAEEKEAAKQEEDKKEKKEKPKGNNRNREVDPDPDGEELLKTTDPLGEANKFLADLLLFNGESLETHLLAIEVYTRKNKPLLVLRSLNKALALDATHPDVHSKQMAFLQRITTEEQNPIIAQVIALERQGALGSRSPQEQNDEYVKTNQGDLPRRIAGAHSAVVVGGKARDAFNFATNFPLDKVSLKDALAVVAALQAHQLDTAAWRARCATRFPLTPAFMPSPDAVDAFRVQHTLKEPI